MPSSSPIINTSELDHSIGQLLWKVIGQIDYIIPMVSGDPQI